MRIFFLGLSVLLGFTVLAAADARLRIGVETADAPISFVDAQGKPAGFTAELLAAMARAGLSDIDIVAAPWSSLMREFQAGRLDVLANVSLTAERQREMDFTVGHAFVHGLIYTRKDRPPIRLTTDFAGKTIGSLSGSIAYLNAVAQGGWGGTIKAFTNPQEAMDATFRGETDGTLLVYGLDKKYLKQTHGLRREFVDDIIHQFRFAVRKGDTATLFRLNEALATVHHNGSFDRLYDQWIGPIEPHPIRLADLRPYAQPLILGALAIAAIIWWQRRMLTLAARQARALRESEERFHGLVETAFEGWVIHRDGVILLANSAYAATFGYTAAELVGRHVLDLAAPESHSVVSAAIAAGRILPQESTGLRKDGTRIPIETAGQHCTFDGRPSRVVAVRDLSAKKQAAADQLVLSKLESTGILAGGLAHDFNNLLAMQVLNLDLVLATERYLSPDAIRCLQAAKNATATATSLTQQLLTFSRGGAFVRQPTELTALLHKTVPLALSGANVRGEILPSPGLWRVEIDPGQIDRVIGNLVLNAREAMSAGGTLTLQATNLTLRADEVPTLPAGDYIRLDVIDRGPGIAPAILSKIFDPYFSTKERGTQKGMGLGLTICHSIAHQHGGSLTVTSTLGAGTTFHLYLPATQEPAVVTPSPSAPAAPRSARILVMDDEESLRETVALALRQRGYTVVGTADGSAAVARYTEARTQNQPFDLVILDLTVRGGMGGLEALAALRALDPAVQAIVMSGYSRETILREHTAHGFAAALPKPFTLDTLYATVTRLLTTP